MSKLTLIIPSLDRAQQLDCFLRSLLRYWYHNDLNIKVLYKYSSSEYEQGYCKCFEKHPYIQPSLEYDFCRQIKDFVNKANPVIGFATDDSVVYNRPELHPSFIENYVLTWKDCLCFSMRLSPVTIIQNYLTGEIQQQLIYKEISDNVIEWNWKRYHRYSNYGYEFSWDMHLYKKEWLKQCFNICCNFESPRALEHQINVSDRVRDISPNKMLSCKTSSVFVNTINAVQDNNIPAGVYHKYTPKDLNDRFLNGEIISLASFAGLQLHSCHDEIPLIFEKE